LKTAVSIVEVDACMLLCHLDCSSLLHCRGEAGRNHLDVLGDKVAELALSVAEKLEGKHEHEEKCSSYCYSTIQYRWKSWEFTCNNLIKQSKETPECLITKCGIVFAPPSYTLYSVFIKSNIKTLFLRNSSFIAKKWQQRWLEHRCGWCWQWCSWYPSAQQRPWHHREAIQLL